MQQYVAYMREAPLYTCEPITSDSMVEHFCWHTQIYEKLKFSESAGLADKAMIEYLTDVVLAPEKFGLCIGSLLAEAGSGGMERGKPAVKRS